MGDAWEQRSSLLLWQHRVGGSKPNMVTVLVEHVLISSRFLIPCFFSSITVVTLPSGGGAHTIEQGTRQFRVRHFAS